MNFYTYSHSSPEGKIFYIGKGTGSRAFSFSDRNQNWKRAIQQHKGVKIQILSMWETEKDAFEHEKFLIQCFEDMQIGLVNQTKGGKGAYGLKQTEEANLKRKQKNTGYIHKTIICPNCKTSGGETSMKRWHFDKCTGKKGKFKASATVNGKKVFLGYWLTKDEATKVIIEYYKSIDKPLPQGFLTKRSK